jgi:hypothetical protein
VCVVSDYKARPGGGGCWSVRRWRHVQVVTMLIDYYIYYTQVVKVVIEKNIY